MGEARDGSGLAAPGRRARPPVPEEVVAAGAALGAGVLLGVLMAVVPSPRAALVLSDVGQLLAAVVAALSCAVAAAAAGPVHRRTWGLMAAATGSWAAGQAWWSHQEVWLGRAAPFPSPADVGFLLFPVLAAAGALRWGRADARGAGRARDALDGVLLAVCLLALSWATVLGGVVAEGGATWSTALAAAYPLTDVVLGTLVLLFVVRVPAGARGVPLLVAAGMASLAVADSAYVYLVSTGGYDTGDPISAAWATGFLLVAAGACCSARSRRGGPPERPAALVPSRGCGSSRLAVLAPVGAVVLAEAALADRLLGVHGVPVAELTLVLSLGVVVVVRQTLALVDNQRLLAELTRAQADLRHQTLHDPLTGVPNRLLLMERLQHALSGGTLDLAVLFCDVDGFKAVNDTHGHDVGDELLREVARRCEAVLRAQDTVARLGGDEFAVLLEGPADVAGTVEAIRSAVERPCSLGGRAVQVGVSIGAATWTAAAAPAPGAEDPQRVAQQLLQSADAAMYAAKSAGRRRRPPAAPPHPRTSAEDVLA